MEVQSKPISSGRIPLAFGAAETTKTFTLKGLRGTLFSILLEAFDSTNNVTRTVAITDLNSKTLFSKGTLSDATTTLIAVRLGESKDVPMNGLNKTLTVTLSGVPGGSGGTDYVTVWVV